MGNCLGTNSAEYRAYAQGLDPDLLSRRHQDTLRQHQENLPIEQTAAVLSHHASKLSVSSFYSVDDNTDGDRAQLIQYGAAALAQGLHWGTMTPQQKDEFMLEQMQKEVEALKRRKAFLESIKSALEEVNNGDANSIDSEDENDQYQDRFNTRLARTLSPAQTRAPSQVTSGTPFEFGQNQNPGDVDGHILRKVDNFKLKQFKRRSIQRNSVTRTKASGRFTTSTKSKSRLRRSLDIRNSNARSSVASTGTRKTFEFDFEVKELKGEGSREWDNPFASRLMLVRKFYDWNDIPLEFFVDRRVEIRNIDKDDFLKRPRGPSTGTDMKSVNGNATNNPTDREKVRELLAARLFEKRAIQTLRLDAGLKKVPDVIQSKSKNKGDKNATDSKLKRKSRGRKQVVNMGDGSGDFVLDLDKIKKAGDEDDSDDDSSQGESLNEVAENLIPLNKAQIVSAKNDGISVNEAEARKRQQDVIDAERQARLAAARKRASAGRDPAAFQAMLKQQMEDLQKLEQQEQSKAPANANEVNNLPPISLARNVNVIEIPSQIGAPIPTRDTNDSRELRSSMSRSSVGSLEDKVRERRKSKEYRQSLPRGQQLQQTLPRMKEVTPPVAPNILSVPTPTTNTNNDANRSVSASSASGSRNTRNNVSRVKRNSKVGPGTGAGRNLDENLLIATLERNKVNNTLKVPGNADDGRLSKVSRASRASKDSLEEKVRRHSLTRNTKQRRSKAQVPPTAPKQTKANRGSKGRGEKVKNGTEEVNI